MKCTIAVKQLSSLVDEILEGPAAEEIRKHLTECLPCGTEYRRLVRLREELWSLKRPAAPPYLRHLVQLRIEEVRNQGLGTQFREYLEYLWSRIRTTERIWYLTRILGTAATFVFFLALSSAVSPIYLDLRTPNLEHNGPSLYLRQQLGVYVLKNLGLLPVEVQRRPISPREPRINDLYLLEFGETASRIGSDDSFSVFTVVDRSGTAKIQNVLEYPSDERLLQRFNTMISSAQLSPASQNGRPVDSHLVLTFNKISVYD